jgi:HlyD family secretion protein
MDFPRPLGLRDRRRRNFALLVGAVTIVGGITMGLSRVKPAAPLVERSTLWIDTVKRGSLVRQVHGLGILTPEEIRFIPTITDGRVERILVRPGAAVTGDTVLTVLTNPTVEQQLFDAEWKLRAEQAQYHSLEISLESQVLDQKANAAKAEQDAEDAQMRAEADEALGKQGIVPEQTQKLSAGSARQLKIRAEIEVQRYANAQKQAEALLAAEKAHVAQARALFDLASQQKNRLEVRAGMDGILQELSLNGSALQAGELVPAGTTIAKVANPKRLKAELKLPETQTKDVQLGQQAEVDTHNGVIPGRVVRIDPSIQNGTRTVDVAVQGELPPGAVPDLSVDGTIDLERISSVLIVSRPAAGQENGTIGLFRLDPSGKTGSRVSVTLGRSAMTSIEVLRGLKEGDQVILSDMSRWDGYDLVRVE